MLESSLFAALTAVPGVLLDVGAIVLAIARWKRHPTVSMFACVGIGLHLSIRLGYAVLPMVLSQLGTDSHNIYMVVGGVSALVGTVGNALIFGAIFSDRVRGDEAPAPRW